MAVQIEELIEFIQANPDPRELKRALAVQMMMQNYKHSTIGNILGVSVGFVNKWKYIYSFRTGRHRTEAEIQRLKKLS